jgi:transcriptional regulator of arginine metabolism
VTDTRARRQKLIAELIRSHQVTSQEEVTARLAQQGFAITQATVSRDLEQLGAFKVKRNGVSAYALPDQLGSADWPVDRVRRLVIEWVQSADQAGNLVVLKTPPGSAHLVALAIDQARLPDVAGTIAGDDTIFVAVRETGPAARLADWFRNPPAE